MDRSEDQTFKRRQMPTEAEKQVAQILWNAQMAAEKAERKVEEFYRPLFDACNTKAEAETLLQRVPDCVAKVFFIDYVHFAREW